MSFLSSLWLTLFQHPISRFKLISTALVLVIVFTVIRFYRRVSRYPKGPCPYPIIGNLTYLSTNSINSHHTLSQFHLKYGPVFTIWTSHKPFVFIADPELVNEAFQKPEFSDRGLKYLSKLFTMDSGSEIAFTNYNRVLIEQKKLLQSAIRKYVTTDELDKVANECVDMFWGEIKSQCLEKPIDMPKYFLLIIIKITTRSLYGSDYTLDDLELKQLKNASKKFPRAANLMFILDLLPNSLGQFFFNFLIKTSWLGLPEINRVMVAKYHEHLNSYKNGRIRDVVDSLIAAKEEAVLEDRESAEHLNDDYLINILTDFFIGSVETTTHTLDWMFLLMAKHPEMQSKMRLEIRKVIGYRLPKQEDRKDCPFTTVFINESLRLQTPAPIAMAHQTKTDVEIGGHKIPGQTTVVSYLYSIHRNDNFWSKPEKFNPTRFLDIDGKLKTNQQPAFIPFGSGRRSCPGEKLAQLDLFLVVARMFQLTDQMGLELTSDSPINDNADPSAIVVLIPVNYKLVLKPRLDQ